jgi:hypothetical protein
MKKLKKFLLLLFTGDTQSPLISDEGWKIVNNKQDMDFYYKNRYKLFKEGSIILPSGKKIIHPKLEFKK